MRWGGRSYAVTVEGVTLRNLKYVPIAGLITATLVGYLGSWHAYFELFANARSQLFFVAAIAVIAAALLKSKATAGLALAAVVLNGLAFVPYWVSSAEPSTSPDLTVLQYNVYFGNDDHDRIVNHIVDSNAEIVVLSELMDTQWQEMESGLAEAYPHQIVAAQTEGQGQLGGGMAILSRTPLLQIDVDPEANTVERKLLAATTTIDASSLAIIGLHPHASRFESHKVELREVQFAAVVELASNQSGPTIIATDMNVTPTSPAYKKFVSDLGWADPHKTTGWHPTFPRSDTPLGLPIDHVFVSNDLQIMSYQTGDGGGSDHRSLIAQISFDGTGS